MEKYSKIMKLMDSLGLQRIKWSLRRLHVPVNNDALVLEVGAGGNPYPRSNILLDAGINSLERCEANLILDRPLVLGITECLPFKDNAFDFVIASHVLEHTSEPIKFLTEIERVSKAGYIETPLSWFEQICAFTFHRLEVREFKNKLLIRKKPSWKYTEISKEWDENLKHSKIFNKFLVNNPEAHHLRYYWKEKINFEILNDEIDCSWEYPKSLSEKKQQPSTLKNKIQNFYLSSRRKLLSQNKRNRKLDIISLLLCPICKKGGFKAINSILSCTNCNREFPYKDGIPHLFPKEIDNANKLRISLN